MKTLSAILFALTFLVSPFSQAALKGQPFIPEIDQRFNTIEGVDSESNPAIRQVRAVWDTTLGTEGATGAHGLGVYLPAGASILRGWMVINRTFPTGGTVAISCEDANNIFTATDLSLGHYASNGTLVKLIPQDTVATVVKGTTIAAKCELTATVATAAMTGGKLTIWLEYFVQ